MTSYNTIAENPNSTVVAEYVPIDADVQKYQSEAELEVGFIRILQSNGYEYLKIRSNDDLLLNLRAKLSLLNSVTFSDAEWTQFLTNYLANKNDSIEEKTAKVQEDYIYNLQRDDGTTKNIRIIDKDNIHNNAVQVINQYEVEGAHKNRYDVTILVNGLPLVHVELKRRGVAIREAFNQINRYQRDSFWADSGLFEYVQLFVISNGTHTKYYSNTTRSTHLKEQAGRNSKKTSNSFEFTSWWTDGKNKRISDLVDFAKTFFSKHSLLSVLTRYCVFTTDKSLLVMRPYQIAAAERILNKIAMSTNHHQLGTIDAGGYIWHTTGSGKTLTSFKTAQLASRLDGMDKVIFVVDRKDLDYQTMKEYDKFEKGSANSNTSTAVLARQLANLRHHGLLQAFSRTNRILNSVKTFGNIICFRDLEQATNDALAIFGNKEAGGIVLLKSYSEYYNGWDKDGAHQRGYKELVAQLQERFPLPVFIEGEQAEKDFIKLWGAILRLRNILSSFDEFRGQEILSEREFQDYQSVYLDLYDKLRKTKDADKENINDDIVFEIELVKQITINIDYILQLVAKYHKSHMKDKEILTTIDKAMNSSLELRSKKELIERFIHTLNANTNVERDWRIFTDESRGTELEKIIEEEGLKPEQTRKFMANAFRDGELKSTGTAFAGILPPVPMFAEDNSRAKKKSAVLDKLRAFYEKYFGI